MLVRISGTGSQDQGSPENVISIVFICKRELTRQLAFILTEGVRYHSHCLVQTNKRAWEAGSWLSSVAGRLRVPGQGVSSKVQGYQTWSLVSKGYIKMHPERWFRSQSPSFHLLATSSLTWLTSAVHSEGRSSPSLYWPTYWSSRIIKGNTLLVLLSFFSVVKSTPPLDNVEFFPSQDWI